MISLKKTFSVSLYSDIHGAIYFKFGLTIGTTTFYILISVWMTLISTQGHSCMRNHEHVHFSEILRSIWMKFGMLPQPVGLLKLMLNMYHLIAIQVRKLG